MSCTQRKSSGQSGTNRTSPAKISKRFWLSFPGPVIYPETSSYEWMRQRGRSPQTTSFSKSSPANRNDMSLSCPRITPQACTGGIASRQGVGSCGNGSLFEKTHIERRHDESIKIPLSWPSSFDLLHGSSLRQAPLGSKIRLCG